MKLSILLCLYSLYNAMAMQTRIHVYKTFKDSKVHFDVSAEINTENSPATITVTKKDVDPVGNPIDFAGLCALLQEIYVLKPSSVVSSDYIYLRIEVDGEQVCVTDIKEIMVDQKLQSLKIIWNDSAAFTTKMDDMVNYLMDIGDGGLVVGVTGYKSDDTSVGPDDIVITDRQAENFGTTVECIRKRLMVGAKRQFKEVHLGGPFLQVLDHKLLNWTTLTIQHVDYVGLVLVLKGKSMPRNKYWIKKFGDEEAICEGTLARNVNGKMEFRTSSHFKTMLVVNEPHYNSGLCLSVSKDKATVKGAIVIPDRLLFGFIQTNLDTETEIVVVTFDWLENADGSSHLHALKINSDGCFFNINAYIYFNKKRRSGVAVIQESEQWKLYERMYLRSMHEHLQKKKLNRNCTVEASGPLSVIVEAENDGKYATPLILKVGRIRDVGKYSFEIDFTTN